MRLEPVVIALNVATKDISSNMGLVSRNSLEHGFITSEECTLSCRIFDLHNLHCDNQVIH